MCIRDRPKRMRMVRCLSYQAGQALQHRVDGVCRLQSQLLELACQHAGHIERAGRKSADLVRQPSVDLAYEFVLGVRVNYGEAKDFPASCFLDRQQPEPKVNLLVWPTYTYLHRS